MTKRKCIHIIIRDKFTAGYINYLKNNDLGWDHIFFTFNKDYSMDLKDTNDVYIVENYLTIVREYNRFLEKADRIIVAAFFDEALELLKMPQRYWNKTYIQFWGGDIYRFRQKKKGYINRIKQALVKSLVRKSILKCAAILTLVEKDYDMVEKIFDVKNIRHRVIQVPDDFYELNHLDYEKIVKETNYQGKRRVLIGNSATPENHHLEVFECFKDKVDEKTEIIVPLSYGLDDYRKEVVAKGNELLGSAFVPIFDLMPREQYIGLLSTCDVAIFNNDRQQATGNIILLANLGKKLYLRGNTSMWDFFINLNFSIHNANELKDAKLVDIMSYNKEETTQNYQALKAMETEATKQWIDFFNI